MSVSLVKKSLELTATENHNKNIKNSAKTNSKKNKQKLKKKHLVVDGRKNAITIVKKIREKSRTDGHVDRAEFDVQRLLNLSKINTIHPKQENKLLNNIVEKKKECNISNEQKKSVFTEEDFLNFEKEYFSNQ